MDPQPRFIEPTFGAAIDERLQPHMGERAQYVGENLDGAHPPDITGSALREAGVMRRASLIKLGVAIAALALAGWLTTVVVTSFAAKPTTTEDLTTVWNQAGPTRLGTPTRVTVPAGSTVVAFLVGADLTGIAGTTTGTCTAEPPTIRLGWPVQINRSLTGVLRDGQQGGPITPAQQWMSLFAATRPTPPSSISWRCPPKPLWFRLIAGFTRGSGWHWARSAHCSSP